ncbi:MAG: tripartite tricarboxylate transporter substrate binding protein [Spirochaetales bacterium]|nr:tripartite tricarboxylate transporter substrate binding protein [Spirochaetales bacterium]
MKKVLIVSLMIALVSCFVFARGEAETSASVTKWPQKPINIVVAFGAGGNSDVNTRAIAKHLTKELGQPVVVTNVSGSGGTIGANQVKNAANDGYTILCSQLSMNVAKVVGLVDYAAEAFEPACVFSQASDEVLVARADSGWKTYEDMFNATLAEPGKYRLTSNAGASTQWIAVALTKAGAKFNIVPSGGSGERLKLLLGKHVDVIAMNYNAIKDYVDRGEFVILATDSPERPYNLPNVPTLKEKGVDCEYYYYNTFFFPKGTDKAIVEKFANACKSVIENNKEYAEFLEQQMQPKVYLGPEETVKYYENELAHIMMYQSDFISK